MDSILLPFLLTTNESEAENLLADLIYGYAVPAVKGIARSMFGGPAAREMYYEAQQEEDLEDIIGEVSFKILSRLLRLKESPNEDIINDYRGYVAVTAFNVCNAYVRVKYPNRYQLKNKLRYHLTHQADFALWDGKDGKSLCGFSQWTGQPRPPNCGWINEARMDTDWYINQGQPEEMTELLRAAFTSAKAPILMDDLVSLVADMLKITDGPDGNEVQLEYLKPSELPAYFIDPVDKEWHRQRLKPLWNEIVQLPLPQRVALLLAVSDERHAGLTVIFWERRIASIREIAEAVDMSADAFFQIERNLPLDDNTISKRLGVSRQQVISYRFSARRRLTRRMKTVDKSKAS